MCSLENADQIGGIQLKLKGDFTTLNSKLPSGWELHSHQDNVVLFARRPVKLNSNQPLFEIGGTMEVEELILSDFSGQSIEGLIDNIPDDFVLYSAYPNPFNPETTIRFSLSESQKIIAEVFNLNGKKVRTLAAGIFERGEHQLKFDGRFLASGVYLLKIKSGRTQRNLKLYLIK